MAVLPKRQGLGIGKQLLNAVKDYSKNNGLAGIVLYTSEYATAAKFYGKSGFRQASEYGIRYHGLPEVEEFDKQFS